MKAKAEAEKTRGYQVLDIPISSIEIGRQRMRTDENDDDIIELANSMQAKGLLQAIGVAESVTESYQLLWGLRRLTAAHRLRWATIPARVYPQGSDPVEGTALIENIMRRDLTLEEECDAVTRLSEEEHLSTGAICDLLGKTRSWVNSRLAITNLPNVIRDPLLEGRISLGSAEAIASLTTEGLQKIAVEQAIQSNLTVYQVRAMVEALAQAPSVEEAVQQGMDASPGGRAYVEPCLPCGACHSPRRISELVIVRVCANGCPQPT